MPITKRTITNTGDPLTAIDGTVLSGVEISFQLVDEEGHPTDAWDVLTGERIAPVKETTTTSAQGEFSVSLWPNDRGDSLTLYKCTVKSPYMKPFNAPLPSGSLAPMQWIDFKLGEDAIASDSYSTPLVITAGDTVPVALTIVDVAGAAVDITGYDIVLEVTNSLAVTTDYQCAITVPLTGSYQVDLSALTVGRYSARLQITDVSLFVQHSASFVIEVMA